MAIKLSALRDRRPKTEPIEVEVTDEVTVTFLNPIKRKGKDGVEALARLQEAEQSQDITGMFKILAENGEKDLQKFYKADATLEDIIDVMKEVTAEVQNQSGSMGESQG